MFRWMIHGLNRWLMDALSSVRTRKLAPPGRKSQIPPLRFRPHHKIVAEKKIELPHFITIESLTQERLTSTEQVA